MATRGNIDFKDLQVQNTGNEFDENLKWLDFQKDEGFRLIPTIDEDVKATLKMLKEPESLVNEDAFTRRERLAELIFRNKDYREIFESSIHSKKSPHEYNSND